MTVLKRMRVWFKQASSELFGLDLRSLAIMRILLGFMLIWDLIVRSKDLRAFYADDGAVPRQAVLDFWHRPTYISMHMMSGNWAWEAALFILAGFVSFCFMIGCRTRLMGFLSWFFLISLHVRNPLVLNGGDIVLRVVLFWCLFLPLGARYSVDSAPPRRALTEWARPYRSLFVSVASFGLIMQMGCIYFLSALLKTGSTWRDGSAVYYALNVDYITWRAPSDWLLGHPELAAWATHGTFVLEYWGPFLLLVPFARGPVRVLVCALFIGLHAGFATFMTIGLFPFICMAAWIGLLPGWLWDRLGVGVQELPDETPRFKSRWWTQLLGLLAVYAVITWNLSGLPKHGPCPKEFTQVGEYCMGKDKDKLARSVSNLGDCPEGYEDQGASCKRIDKDLPHAIEPIDESCPNAYQLDGSYCIAQSAKLKHAVHPREVDWVDELYGRPVDEWLKPFVRMFRLDQKWNMFAPNPLKDDGWYVIPGELEDGTEVELFQGGEVDWEKGYQVSDIYVDQRWRKYMRNLYKKSYKDFRIYYGKHLCRSYNVDREGDDRLQTFQIYFVRERTPPMETTTSFIISNDQLDTDGVLDFESCAEFCIQDTKIDEDVTVCEKRRSSSKESLSQLVTRFTCKGREIPEPERVKLWSHRCFKSQE